MTTNDELGSALAAFQRKLSAAEAALEASLAPVARGVEALREGLAPFSEPLAALGKWVEDNQDGIRRITKRILEEPLDTKTRQENLEKLAEFGWYLDPGMPLFAPTQLVRALSEEDEQEVLDVIRVYFTRRLDDIEGTLRTSFPLRDGILRDAFEAHRGGKYNLSVPVLLAQADGMWFDRVSKSPFMSRERPGAVGDLDQKNQHRFFEPLIGLFGESIPLWMSKTERGSTFAELNRHQVLHGEVVDYGTEVNSLKAIAFLSFSCWVLDNHPPNQP